MNIQSKLRSLGNWRCSKTMQAGPSSQWIVPCRAHGDARKRDSGASVEGPASRGLLFFRQHNWWLQRRIHCYCSISMLLLSRLLNVLLILIAITAASAAQPRERAADLSQWLIEVHSADHWFCLTVRAATSTPLCSTGRPVAMQEDGSAKEPKSVSIGPTAASRPERRRSFDLWFR